MFQSILIRWEAPTEDSQNGIITGFKIRYKQTKDKTVKTVTVDGGHTRYSLTGKFCYIVLFFYYIIDQQVSH